MRGDPPVPKELMVDDCQCIVSTGHEFVFSISLTASAVIQAKVVSWAAWEEDCMSWESSDL